MNNQLKVEMVHGQAQEALQKLLREADYLHEHRGLSTAGRAAVREIMTRAEELRTCNSTTRDCFKQLGAVYMALKFELAEAVLSVDGVGPAYPAAWRVPSSSVASRGRTGGRGGMTFRD